jgi:Uma2 family endonuclease
LDKDEGEAAMEATLKVGMSLEQFLEESAAQPFELIHGERRPKLPPVFGHSKAIRLLFRALDHHAVSAKLGEVFSETTFILPDAYDSNWVEGSRIPDIMFYAGKRLTDYLSAAREANERPLPLVPDLVVEVVSPNDKFSEVLEKVDLYLQDGMRLVWVVDLKRKSVLIYTPDGDSPRTLKNDDILTGEDVIAGFHIKLSDLFA